MPTPMRFIWRLSSADVPPEVGATQNRMHFFASRLAARCYDVTVVTEVPNHPAGVIHPAFRRMLWRRTVEDGVRVVRVWVRTAPRKTFSVRLGFYLTYAWNAFFAALFLTGSRHDVVIATSPPLTVGIPALLYAAARRVPFTLDVRDLWPELAVALGEMRNPWAIAAARKLELLLYRRAAAVTVVTRGFARYIEEQGCPSGKITFLPNGTMPEIFHPVEPDGKLRESLRLTGRFVVGFFGNHGIAQDLESVLEAAVLTRDDPAIGFLFVGEGPVKADLVARCAQLELENVQFLPQLPQTAVVRYIALADVVLVPLRKLELLKTFIPSKLFDFMASGRPIVLQVDGEAREIVEASGAGVFVPPGEPEALAAELRRLAATPRDHREAMGQAGLSYVRTHYLREQQVVTLEGLLRALVARRAWRSASAGSVRQ